MFLLNSNAYSHSLALYSSTWLATDGFLCRAEYGVNAYIHTRMCTCTCTHTAMTLPSEFLLYVLPCTRFRSQSPSTDPESNSSSTTCKLCGLQWAA